MKVCKDKEMDSAKKTYILRNNVLMLITPDKATAEEIEQGRTAHEEVLEYFCSHTPLERVSEWLNNLDWSKYPMFKNEYEILVALKLNPTDNGYDAMVNALGTLCSGISSYDDYSQVFDFAKSHGFDYVYDIGCATGHQSEHFIMSNIQYVGIEFWKQDGFRNADRYTYIVGKYPFEISVLKKALAVSAGCIGNYEPDKKIWEEQFKQLSKDFENALITLDEDCMGYAEKYFSKIEKLSNNWYWLHK